MSFRPAVAGGMQKCKTSHQQPELLLGKGVCDLRVPFPVLVAVSSGTSCLVGKHSPACIC